jgi:hypothetical protein
MIEDKSAQGHVRRPFRARGDARSVRRRVGQVTQYNPMREIIDVAMVGLIGGGPRLAIRAARVFLEDSYIARVSARQARGDEGTSSLNE